MTGKFVLVMALLFTLSAYAQDSEVFLEPPAFFHHPDRMVDPYGGRCKRFDGVDCCGRRHCYPVPSDDRGRLQLKTGEWVDPYTMAPSPTICDSSLLVPGYNWLDHVCEGGPNEIRCVFLKGQSS